jgi:Bacterial CdiA-CT RNAse A domain
MVLVPLSSHQLFAVRSALSRAQWQVRGLRITFRLKRFNPAQPRVPAGHPDGGQWTDGGGGGGSGDATLIPVGSRDEERTPLKVDLEEEEASGGHAIRQHVGKSDAELIGRLEREFGRVRFLRWTLLEWGRKRAGAFPSLNEANEWVNRTIEANRTIVEDVASGQLEKVFLTHRFGFVTRREAIVVPIERTISIRKTYSVGVTLSTTSARPAAS